MLKLLLFAQFGTKWSLVVAVEGKKKIDYDALDCGTFSFWFISYSFLIQKLWLGVSYNFLTHICWKSEVREFKYDVALCNASHNLSGF